MTHLLGISERLKIYGIIGLGGLIFLSMSCDKRKIEVSDTIQESERLIQVKEAFLQGDWDKVIQYGEEGMEKEPDDEILSWLLLRAYMLKGDDFFRKAVKFENKRALLGAKTKRNLLWAEELVRKYPQNCYAHFYLAKVQNEPKKSLAAFEKAIEINPQFAESYAGMGIEYRNKKAWDKAEYYLKKALKNQQNSEAKYLWLLADLYLLAEKHKLAESCALKAIEKKPDMESAYLTLGRTYAEMNDFEKAINTWKEFIRLVPEEKTSKELQTQVLLLENELKKKKILLKSSSVNEKDILIVKEAFLQGDWDKVIQYGEEGFKKEPNNVILCHLLHSAYEFKGDIFLEKTIEFMDEIEPIVKNKDAMDKMLTWAENLTQNYPQNYYVQVCLGKVYKALNKDGKAIKCYKKAIEINPEFAEAYYKVACIYYNKQSLNKAEEYMKKALEKTQNSKVTYYASLADVYILSKDYGLATDYLLRAIEKKPDNARFHMLLGAVHSNQGNVKTAKIYLQEAIRLDPDGKVGKKAKEWLSLIQDNKK